MFVFKKAKLLLIFYILVNILMVGCKGDKGDVGLTGPQGPILTGNISGFVELHSKDFLRYSDNSGVEVSVEGTNISTTTDINGRWTLSNLSTGTYNIVFTKTGFGNIKKIGYQFAGGGTAYLDKIILVQKPSIKITSISTNVSSSFYVSGELSTNANPNYGSTVLLFMDTTNNVSSNPNNYLICTNAWASNSSIFYELNISHSQLREILSLQSGTHVYIAAYSTAVDFYNCVYTDPITGKDVYTAISDSSINTSFVMP